MAASRSFEFLLVALSLAPLALSGKLVSLSGSPSRLYNRVLFYEITQLTRDFGPPVMDSS
jgi:hypothetical protein